MLNSPDHDVYPQVESLALVTNKTISDEDYREAIKNALNMFPNLRDLRSTDFMNIPLTSTSNSKWIQELRNSSVTSLTFLLGEYPYRSGSLDAFLNVAEELNHSPITELTVLRPIMYTTARAYAQFIEKCAKLNKITLEEKLCEDPMVQDALAKNGFKSVGQPIIDWKDYITFEKKGSIARTPYIDVEVSCDYTISQIK
jgi:hypothetical protein